jgi:sugar lactone lactonase YvrE
MRSQRGILGFVLAGVLVAGAATLSPATADSGVVPVERMAIGGPGHAETYPSGLETTADGGVVLADTAQDRVERYDAAGNLLWTYGTHGTGPNRLTTPRDIGIDADGYIYVSDTGNTSIVKLTPDGRYVARFTGPSTDRIKSPIGVTVANGKVLVADAAVPAIRVLRLDGVQEDKITSPAGCPFAAIRDVTRDAAGNFYVANYTRNNVLKLRPDGSCLASFGVKGTGELQWKNPYGVAVARDPVLGRQLLYVADSNNNRIQVLRLNGTFVTTFGTHGGFGIDGTFDELRHRDRSVHARRSETRATRLQVSVRHGRRNATSDHQPA